MTRLQPPSTRLSGLRSIGFLVLAATLFVTMTAHMPAMAQTTVTDALGRQVAVPETMRVLSLGPDVTEIV